MQPAAETAIDDLARRRVGRRDAWAVGVALLFPTLITWVYFVLLANSSPSMQQAAYVAGKILQFGFPLAWVLLHQRKKIAWHWPQGRDIVQGLLLGSLIAAAALVVYKLARMPGGIFDAAAPLIRDKVAGMGFNSLPAYFLLSLFYALFHSLFEEYYWRWFVFGQLRRLVSLRLAIGLSSLGFMAHHVLVLVQFFGPLSPWTAFFSLSVAVGGILWAWVYERTGSLYGPWASHLLVDAGIFLIGYDLIRDSL
jgi:uncharacterized protein